MALQRVDEKTYQDALAYVEKLLQETDDVIEYDFVDEADSALTDESKAEINKIHLKGFFSNKARIEEGAKHVAALDKNRPMTKRYKKYFGLGLALTILAGLLIASAAVAIGIALGPALPALAAAIGVIKLIGSIVCAYSLTIVVISFIVQAPEGLLFLALPLAPILAPLIGGIRLLNKAHKLSKTREDLSFGLAQAFPALTKKSYYNEKPTSELSQSLLTQTIDAKIAKAEEKLAAFKENKAKTQHYDAMYYVDRAIEYYDHRVQYLNVLKDSKETNDTILILSRLTHRLEKTEDVNERAALNAEISACEYALFTDELLNLRSGVADSKEALINFRDQAAEISTNADFMKTLPTVKYNSMSRVRFFYSPGDLKYHNDHQAKTQAALTPAASK